MGRVGDPSDAMHNVWGAVPMPDEMGAPVPQEDAAQFLISLFLKKELKIAVTVPRSQA